MKMHGRWTIALVVISALALGCSKKENEAGAPPSPQSEAPKQEQPPPPPPEPAEPSAMDLVLENDTLPEAIETAKPLMNDTRNEESIGAMLLALWAANKGLKWEDLQALPQTKYKLVMKDPEEQRGKRLCARGQIVQIQVERTELGKLFHGVFMTNNFEPLSYSVVGSTGELVEQSRATLCGVVTGLKSYSNVQGGTTHSVYLVGMFDLPENRAAQRK